MAYPKTILGSMPRIRVKDKADVELEQRWLFQPHTLKKLPSPAVNSRGYFIKL